MKKLNQLLIIEADADAPPLLSRFQFLPSFSEQLPVVKSLEVVSNAPVTLSFHFIVLHSNLTTMNHLRRFVDLYAAFPYSSIVVVSQQQDEELALLALEAGAEDCINVEQLTAAYMNKAVITSFRRNRAEYEVSQYRTQLLACLQNTPNVAVQWYNSKSEVLFWNKASEVIFGWTAEEAMGKRLQELINAPASEALWLYKMQHIANTEVLAEPEEWSFHRRDGTIGCCISTWFSIPSFNNETMFVCMDVDITERKLMEEALHQSQTRYHTLFSRASDAIFINDLKGKFLDVNQRACELMKYPKEKLLSMTVEDLYTKEELFRQPIMWKELWMGKRTSIEREAFCSDGTLVPIEVTAQMLDDNRIMAIVRDVSERREAEKALRLSEEKYRSLIEQQADAIAIFDMQGRIRQANTSATQLLQYTKDELQNMTLTDIFFEEEEKSIPFSFTALEQGVAVIKQQRLRRKDGNLVQTEVNAKHLWDGIFIASVRDLTERIAVQHLLEKEKELSDSIINSLPGLFYLFTKEGRYLRWNKQQEIISGYTPEEIVTMSPLDFIAESHKTIVQEAIAKTFENGASSTEAELLTKEGRRIPFYFTGIKVEYAGTVCLLGTGIDLSAMKNLENELSQQKIAGQKKIMQAMIDAEEKEKAKLGLELHDNISQILSVVRMYLAILDSSEVPEGITLPRTTQLLDTAINEIRSLSHNLAISYKFEGGLTEALKELIDNVRLARDFSVDFKTPPSLDEYTNTNQKLALYRIIQEQLNNIIKYAKASAIAVHVAVTNNEVQLTISDNGKGFNPLKVEKGLGLNNITNRTEALGGKVKIWSELGKGCRVEVQIPLQPTQA